MYIKKAHYLKIRSCFIIKLSTDIIEVVDKYLKVLFSNSFIMFKQRKSCPLMVFEYLILISTDFKSPFSP